MKRLSIVTITSVFTIAMVLLVSCSGVKRNPNKTYMPDMAYSRAYETYSVTADDVERLKKEGIHYSNMPVAGTVARGEELPYHLPNDSNGYKLSATIKNPLPALTTEEMAEAKRLFNINCAICHGDKLDGNGPLYKGGNGPYAAAPAAFLSNPKYLNMAEGTMFHSITFGLNMMGSYASQLSRKQRWMIVHYIKSKQAEVPGKTATAESSTADSAVTAKK
ncbi:MAG TPA: cytochrome c [Chitinophagaceae bacterium]|nr:cytochrome c [Chitinophagaceae bacterium]